MTKRVLSYIIGLTAVISLQSCVSSYVVSSPKVQTEDYKTNAKLASIENKNLDEVKKQLIGSFASVEVEKVKKETYEDVLKREELANNMDYVEKILKSGAEKARDIASEKVSLVRKTVGLMGRNY